MSLGLGFVTAAPVLAGLPKLTQLFEDGLERLDGLGYRLAFQATELGAAEARLYDPVTISRLTRLGIGLHSASTAVLLGGFGLRALEEFLAPVGSKRARRAGHEQHVAQLLLKLSFLFALHWERTELREALLAELRAALLPAAHLPLVGFEFTRFAHELAEYVTRDLELVRQPPCTRTITASNGRVLVVEDHPLYTLIRPQAGRSSLFVSIPHDGIQLPPEDLALRARSWRVAHSDSDLWLHRLWEAVPMLGGTLMVAKMGQRLRFGPMSKAASAYRMRVWHQPYVRRREEELDAIQGERGMVFIISARHCPTVPTKAHADWVIKEFRKGRPLFIPGTTRLAVPLQERHAGRVSEAQRTLAATTLARVEAFFRRQALAHFPDLLARYPEGPVRDRMACSVDSPYGGAGECWTMDPSPERRRPGFQLELVRELLLHERSPSRPGNLQPNERFRTTQGIVTEFVRDEWPQLEADLRRHYGLG